MRHYLILINGNGVSCPVLRNIIFDEMYGMVICHYIGSKRKGVKWIVYGYLDLWNLQTPFEPTISPFFHSHEP